MGGIGRAIARGIEGGGEAAALIFLVGLVVVLVLWYRARKEREEEAEAVARGELDELETYDGWRKAQLQAWKGRKLGLVGWVKLLAALTVLVVAGYAVVVVLFILPLTS